jgi:hypothetical protein
MARKWHKGPPPHAGWWNASAYQDDEIWRFWDGVTWSIDTYEWSTAQSAADAARRSTVVINNNEIEWTYYWPKNARVPRINPNGANNDNE